MTALRILEHGQERRLGPADFPVALGGPGSPVSVAAAAFPVAWLGLSDGEVFVQPVAGAGLLCNGSRLTASHWLRDGDVLRLGATRVEVRLRGADVVLALDELAEANPTEPPVVLVPPPRGTGRDDAGSPGRDDHAGRLRAATRSGWRAQRRSVARPGRSSASPSCSCSPAWRSWSCRAWRSSSCASIRCRTASSCGGAGRRCGCVRASSRSRGVTAWLPKRKATGGSRRPSTSSEEASSRSRSGRCPAASQSKPQESRAPRSRSTGPGSARRRSRRSRSRLASGS